MNKLIINRNSLIIGIIVWWWIFLALSFTHFNNFQILNIVGFLFLSIVPGMLTLLSLRLNRLPFWANLSLSIAFSLLELMIVVLIGNFLLPKFGIAQPLAQHILIIEISILLFILSLVAWNRLDGWKLNIVSKLRGSFPNKLNIWLSFLPTIFVLQSVIGAFSLNNGGSGLWTLAMLGEIAVYILILYIYAKKIGENTIPTALYFISLALLLMTSLRGWYITGHDIQVEYRVFQFAKNSGVWNMAVYQDAYNACLSITILPTLFFNLLRVSDPYIYKFLFQFFFAVCPGLTYLISRNWIDKRISFLAGFYFLSFVTFFADMPFLIRQEVAFIFYGLMLYVIFEPRLDIKIRRILFVFMGIGVILSHYSTTYTILMIFTLSTLSRPIFIKSQRYFNRKLGFFNKSALIDITNKDAGSKANITLVMIVILFASSFIWTSLITNTGGNLSKVLRETISAIGNGFTEDTRSTDATNLLSFRSPSQQEEFDDFVKKVIEPIRMKSPNAYFDKSLYNKYQYLALPDEKVPLTKIGKLAQGFNVNFVGFITLFGRTIAKFMEILAPLGIFYVLFRKSFFKYLNVEFYLIAFYCLFFIFLIIVIPVLSTEYGIFRAMQQSMFVLALLMICGSLLIGSCIVRVKHWLYYNLWIRKIQIEKSFSTQSIQYGLFPIIISLLLFMYSTSFIQQVFGNNSAQLHLTNAGRYYDNYLIKTIDVFAVDWLGNLTKGDISGLKIQIQTDKYSQRKLASLSNLDAYNDIFPGVVRRDSYVYLGQATAKKHRATLVYIGDQITYEYPVEFLDDNKNLIYNNGGSRIYR